MIYFVLLITDMAALPIALEILICCELLLPLEVVLVCVVIVLVLFPFGLLAPIAGGAVVFGVDGILKLLKTEAALILDPRPLVAGEEARGELTELVGVNISKPSLYEARAMAHPVSGS